MKIAICGQARSGKDVIGAHLERHYGFTRFAFADEMKRLLHELFPHIPKDPKPRRAYQVFGEGLRKLDLPGAPSVWIDATLRNVELRRWLFEGMGTWHGNVVITDLRTQEEYARLRHEGFTIIRVTAPEELRLARARAEGDAFEAENLTHETEQALVDFAVDFEVVNDGSLAELRAKVDAILVEIKEAD